MAALSPEACRAAGHTIFAATILWLLIPTHRRHRVTRTAAGEAAVWLAVHYVG